MSDLKIVMDPESPESVDPPKPKLPVAANDAALNRRDLDVIKRDLISVRKDYSDIRENMVILTHQYSRTPSKSFFVMFGLIWLALLAGVLTFQPQLTTAASALAAKVLRH